MSDETTLLPCPFCGGEAHISDDYSSKHGMVYSVWHDCPDGGGYHPYGQGVGVLQVTSAWFSSREEAIAAWNTRATLGSGTCEPKWTLQFETQTQEFWRCECGNCGHVFGDEDRRTFPFKMTIDDVDVPNFCPECGAKQKVVGE